MGTQTGVRVCGLQVRSLSRPGQTDPEPLGVDSNRPAYSNRKTGASGETPHKTHPVAPQKTLDGPRISGKGDSSSKVPSPAPSMVDQRDKCLTRPNSAPFALMPFKSLQTPQKKAGVLT